MREKDEQARCEVCGRNAVTPPDYAGLPQPSQCWSEARPGSWAEVSECYRLGYEREKARADAAERDAEWEARALAAEAARAKLTEALRAARAALFDTTGEWGQDMANAVAFIDAALASANAEPPKEEPPR